MLKGSSLASWSEDSLCGGAMAVAFTRISCWIWSKKIHETPSSALNSADIQSGFREPEHLKFPPADESRMRSSSRRVRRKWQSRDERRIDKEYDVVIVPSDGGCMSGSESDDSDWSIGWMEPHASEFQGQSEVDNSFAVLVPCYGRSRADQLSESPKERRLGAIKFLDDDAPDGKKYIEEWLASL